MNNEFYGMMTGIYESIQSMTTSIGMHNFLIIDMHSLNLFSFMLGIMFAMSKSIFGGRTVCTKITYAYLAVVIFYFASKAVLGH